MKKIIVTFDFDPETETVLNVDCKVDGVEKKKKRSVKKLTEVIEDDKEPIITLSSNKITFNKKCVEEMKINAGDRIVIKWEKKDNSMIPIIGTDFSFDEEGTGNKLTKNNTITYKGKSNLILSELGTEFKINSIEEGIWELIPINGQSESIESITKVVEDLPLDIIVNTDEQFIIDDLQYSL